MENLAPQPDRLASISEAQWIVLWLKLRLYTRRRFGGLCDKFGWDSDSIAHEAIVATMDGIRRWPPIDSETGRLREDIDLFFFLCQVARSIVSHRYAKEKGQLSIDASDPDSGSSVNQFYEQLLHETSFRYPQLVRPDTTESDVMYRLLTDEMCVLVADDAEVLEIMKLWRLDPTLKPREIAEQLGMSMKQMRAAQKRLRRLLKKLREG